MYTAKAGISKNLNDEIIAQESYAYSNQTEDKDNFRNSNLFYTSISTGKPKHCVFCK